MEPLSLDALPPGRTDASGVALADLIVPRLKPAAAIRCEVRLRELREAADGGGVGEALTALLTGRPQAGAFIASVLDCSPFLRSLILTDMPRLVATLAGDPADRLAAVIASTAKAWHGADEAGLMSALRRARQETALLVALADLGGVWDVDRVTAALSDFAAAALGASVRLILRDAAAAGQLTLAEAPDPETGCGWIILGMGKFGARELNYSSDIDLIVLYDPDRVRLSATEEPAERFVRYTKRLVHILNDHTSDGYVYRTDLRLRPDPGSTSIAISTEAALNYYESLGQNWERAALIKARPVAGDRTAGAAFLAELTPYIWRKYLDFAAIADIHSIKRQIHDYRGHDEIAVAGHNIKLGRGGIREIEFFVQTQQLIAGGRHRQLRGNRTLDMLAALADAGWIDTATRDELSRSYRMLRTIEHCLQMIADEQTHTLPEDEAGLAVIAAMAGYGSREEFAQALIATLTTVRDRYAALFEAAPTLTAAGRGSLAFTGDADDPETLATLRELGYREPTDVTRTVRSWHFGRYAAMRSARARERLTEVTPALLAALAATDNADVALVAFDRFLSRLPAGVQLFSLLSSNPALLDLIATIMGTAPRLAETIIRRAHVLDTLIEPAFFGQLPDRQALQERLDQAFAESGSYEEILDRARVFGQEQWFLIGVRLLAGTIGARQAGRAYTVLAEVLAAGLLAAARSEFEAVHGKIPGAEIALVAMGKLGGREMTAASDLDLMLLYDFADGAAASDGKRPLAGGLYFARLTQRLLAALSSPTAEGGLYQVDFRLRPSGNAGPIATHIDAFTRYQADSAWTWEHMALTRARPIAGDPALMKRAADEIAAVITRRREPGKLASDVREMRGMIEAAKGGEGPWDIKIAPGGLVDIEFIAQYLQLRYCHDHPDLISTETEIVLTATVQAGLLARAEADVLLPALRLYQSLTQVLRLCVEGRFWPGLAPRGLLSLLAKAGELPDFATLDAHLRETENAVRRTFERLLDQSETGSDAVGERDGQ
jgi:glutamate-ammonia-ligase adenylyltransferase